MSKENYVKQELCRQIRQLNLEQLQQLTDLISDSTIDGLSNPDEVLTCDRCEALYGNCGNDIHECRLRYKRYLDQ